MAWTTPAARAYGYTVTESNWNTDAVDNLNYLKSKADRRFCIFPVIAYSAALSTGTPLNQITLSSELNGFNLVDADAGVHTPSSSGAPTIQIYNVRHGANVLSTAITIDASEYTSYTAATAPAINGSYDDVQSGDRYRFNVSAAGTGTAGLDVMMSWLLS